MRAMLTRWLCLGSSLFTLTTALAGPPATAPLPADPHPLRFVPNRQQWEAPVLFAADIPAGRLFLEKNRLLVARYDVRAADERHHHRGRGAKLAVPAHAYAVNFVGANAKPAVRGEQPTGEHLNYFLGNDRRRWATDVPAFTDVRYQQLYPGTDLRFYSRGPVMEYDFELAAGADARRIQLKYEGQQSLRVVDGALQIETSVGRVTEQQPFAYQLVHGRRVAVPCHYVLGKGNVVSFGLPKGYNKALPLVIDPVLVYSTYSGATAALNWGYTACPDTAGNLYAASVNFSAGYPTTTGAYDASFNGGNTDIVISKYNPNATTGASSLVYATYLGGGGSNSADEYPHSLVTNDAGELVILGSTDASNYPTTTGAYDRALGGTTDLVVSRLSAGGNQLLASTYVGGTGIDGRMDQSLALYENFGDDLRGDVILDRAGNVYFTSVSRSTNYPSTGGFQTARGGASDAVVTKLNPGLTALVWSSYLGGTGNESGYSIQLDSLNGVFVAGGTTSTNFPRTTGGLNATSRGGAADGFVAHISPDGSQVVQATYLGTNAYDQAFFVQLDRQGAVYVLGQTKGAYPVTAGIYRNANSRQFIHKLSYGLNATAFSTVIGNGGGSQVPNISPTAFLVDNCGQILLSGWGAANIAGLPTTPDAIRVQVPNSTSGSPNDNVNNTYGYLYLMQLSPGARRLVYGSYFGSGTTHVDGGTSRFDKKGIIYQAICVRFQSNGNLAPAITTTPNAFARTQTGTTRQTTSAAFKMDILRLNADFTPAANGAPNVRTGCAPLTVNFSRPNANANGTTWDFGNGQTSTQANNVSTVYTTPGTYTVRLTAYDSTACTPSVSTTATIVVRGLAKISVGPDRTLCPGSSATLTVANAPVSANYVINWTPATGLSSTTGFQVTATPAATTTYIVTLTELGTNGCESKDTVTVNVSNQLNVSVPTPAPICAGSSTTLTVPDAGPGATYLWSPATGLSATNTRSVTATPTATTTYTVTVATPGGCTGTATTTVAVQQAVALFPQAIIDPTTVGLVTFSTVPGTAPGLQSLRWDFGDGQTSTDVAPTHIYAAPGSYTVRLTSIYELGCTADTTASFLILPVVPTKIPNIITPNHDGLNDDFFPQRDSRRPDAANLEIYNRWGRKVYEEKGYTRGWGTSDGVAPGLYYYHLYTPNDSWTGWLEVVK
ncbi:PKD domain-containing protein [Hymenobacter sp. ASUV-10]|uniref:PKD domain-containing protein n=1 Tax=Hymenobacter aranciens TaxID=3063996 RepID=A0ABT9BJM6_9BACT|nr:PKD domain-containing protein [Hymenobacter sp. ASUV-10]MDO7876733.1 PKD domain-containing protein [Hymenobacter sp. ASUV-10]